MWYNTHGKNSKTTWDEMRRDGTRRDETRPWYVLDRSHFAQYIFNHFDAVAFACAHFQVCLSNKMRLVIYHFIDATNQWKSILLVGVLGRVIIIIISELHILSLLNRKWCRDHRTHYAFFSLSYDSIKWKRKERMTSLSLPWIHKKIDFI